MRLNFTLKARRDLAEAVAYISVDDPAAAQRQFDRVIAAAYRLPDFPLLGAPMGTRRRQLQVPRTPFRLIYTVRAETIEILHVWHGARQWPPRRV